MWRLTVLSIGSHARMESVLEYALSGVEYTRRRLEKGMSADALFEGLQNERVLFAVSISAAGLDAQVCELLLYLRTHPEAMEGCVAAMIIDGEGELYTKHLARMLAFAANGAGCLFPGKPLLEATGSLANLHVQSRIRGMDLEDTYKAMASELTQRLIKFEAVKTAVPKVLVLHASDHKTSNTLDLCDAVRKHIETYCDIEELSLQNGTVHDCRGCSYKTCSHFAAQNTCFYGGAISESIYPAIMRSDALLLLCPNYNDSVGANIMACINRLTGLVIYNDLFDKYLFSIVVSGYSGSDLVAQQVLGALCFNKSFMLPPRFCLMQTANDPGEAIRSPGIEERVRAYANNMLRTVRA